MSELKLMPAERDTIATLLAELTEEFDTAEDPQFLLDAPVWALRLPKRIHAFLTAFRRKESGVCLITGHHVDDAALGPTPPHWNAVPHPSPTLDHDLLLILYSAVLGDAFGWETQQDRRIIHDVLPIRGNENEQLGSASEAAILWHTEDPFHPYRPDWMILACMRNPVGAATTVSRVDSFRLEPRELDILFQPRFVIPPDESHLPKHNSSGDDAAFARIEALRTNPPGIGILSGDPAQPYITADEYFWRTLDDDDEEGKEVLRRLKREMDANREAIVLSPGDYLFVDNYKVVHGRSPFRARYDGTDRWLKRVCITRDLRKSRAARATATDQVVR